MIHDQSDDEMCPYDIDYVMFTHMSSAYNVFHIMS